MHFGAEASGSESMNTNHVKALLVLTALLELATGAALVATPAVPISLLLGTSLDAPGGSAVARVAGAALLSLGIACWLARHDGASRPGRALICAILFYDVAVATVLAHADLVTGLQGIALWPAVGTHTVLAIWCATSLGAGR
jgi:hypothetical protein